MLTASSESEEEESESDSDDQPLPLKPKKKPAQKSKASDQRTFMFLIGGYLNMAVGYVMSYLLIL